MQDTFIDISNINPNVEPPAIDLDALNIFLKKLMEGE